jgi:heptose I phosphotransferase
VNETLWRRLARGFQRVRARDDWEGFAGENWPQVIMSATVTDRFSAKQGRSTGRWVLRAEGRRLAVYLKRHYRLPRWKGLLASIWPERAWSPAGQEWEHLHWARKHGLPVPEAVAVAEFIGPWGRLQSMLAVEELTEMVPLHEAIPAAGRALAPVEFASWKRGLAREMARLVASLHSLSYFHKDLYLCHLYVPAAQTRKVPLNWQGRLHVIDFHRLRRHVLTAPIWIVKDVAQLLFSTEIAEITARDRVRFWHEYLHALGGGLAVRFLKRFILAKAARYRRHNARRNP